MDPLLRRSMYTLMLVLSVGLMVARVVNVELVYEPSLYKAYPERTWPKERPQAFPTFASNDRARWATAKSIVEEGTFVIGRRFEDPTAPKGYRDEGILFTDGYRSVDSVMNPDTKEFFATKPPLFTVAIAGEYWLLHKVLDWNISDEKWEVVVAILLTFNVLPLAIALWLLSRLIERHGTTDWGRLFVFAMACFGTFLTTFAVTLNNHTPAACCILFAVYALIAPSRMKQSESQAGLTPLRLIVAGLFSGMAVCLDLPAAAFGGAVAVVILMQFYSGLLWFIPAFLVAPAAQTAITYEVFDTVVPIYAKFGGPWYKYPGSHWAKEDLPERPKGIDFIHESKDVYAFHFLFGHHGLFSLTPVWLLAAWGMVLSSRSAAGMSRALQRLTPLIAAVVIGFYIFKSNNYGGWTSGPRWLFWLTPLFLLALLPAADRLGRSRTGRGVAYLCLGISVFSATYPWAIPWRHPWIFQWCEYMDWLHY